MVLPPPRLLTKKEKRKQKEKEERLPTLGNFDARPTVMTTLRPAVRGRKPPKKPGRVERKALRKRKKVELKKLKKTRKNARPLYLLPKEVPQEDEKEDMAHQKIPPMTFKVNTKTKCLEVRVQLHKCPHKFVNLDPTPTHFVMDTLNWTKKYEVDKRYPDDIVVDPSKATATFEREILLVSLPIKVFPQKAKDKQAQISSSIREGKRLRFVQVKTGEVIGMRKIEEKERKRKRKDDDSDDDSAVPAQPTKKSKKFIMDKEVLSQMADEAAANEDQKVASRQAKLSATEEYFKEKRMMKLEAKQRKQAVKEKALDKVVERQKQMVEESYQLGLDQKPVLAGGEDARTKGGSNKKVSFAATQEVVKFGGGEDDDKKGKKKKKQQLSIEYRN
jgi:hypothetical protein